MDHDEVVRQQMTEKYLLNELNSADRDRFEEHYFGCPACAADVHGGTLFVEQARVVFAENAEAEESRVAHRAERPNWLLWLRPSFAVPALFLLLAVIGYQNVVTIPQMARQLTSPHVLPYAAVNVGTYGSEAPAVSINPGEGFLVFVRIPPDGVSTRYTAELNDPASNVVWNIAFPAREGQDEYPVEVPGKDWKPGKYSIDVHGVSAAGEGKEVGKALFEVQVRR